MFDVEKFSVFCLICAQKLALLFISLQMTKVEEVNACEAEAIEGSND